MSTQIRNRYQASLREMEFQLFEQGKLGDLLGKEPYAAWGVDEVKLIEEGKMRQGDFHFMASHLFGTACASSDPKPSGTRPWRP